MSKSLAWFGLFVGLTFLGIGAHAQSLIDCSGYLAFRGPGGGEGVGEMTIKGLRA